MVADDLRDRLQTALGAGYTLERELGGGAMSRVFVAMETSLGRRVVVKVLPPDLAADVSADRFRREIQLAAQLQHPHIVPVLSAGASGDLVYYTMPYVEGESLREHLRRQQQLPLGDALRIACEVADALDYAHRHGIVHRDIKPENILLEDGHAVVSDFGIARAVSRATGDQTLTRPGLTIGTPMYMSPEQASGQSEVDGRSDVFSLGCVLYEMLVGDPPFAGPTPQAIVAKRFASERPRIRTVRTSVPQPVEAAVTKSLALVPADRFATAREFAQALGAPDSPRSISARAARARRLSPRVIGMAAAACAVLGLGAAAVLGRRARNAADAVDPRIVAVLPFRVTSADPALGYLREGMIDLLAAKLTGEGGPRAADPRSVVSAWRRAAGSSRDGPSEDVALGIAARLGAGRLLLGGIVGSPARIVINATLLSVPSGRGRLETSVEGPPDSLPALIDRLTAQLLAREAGETERLAALTSTSLAALRYYLEGQSAYRRGRYEEAVRHFERSLQRDSSFALAAIGLFSAAYWTPNTEPLLRGQRLAWVARDRLSPRDRAYVTAWTGPRFPAPASFGEMLAGWQRAVEVAPDRPEPWFELGDILFHFGPLLAVERADRRAGSAFDRAFALDSGFAAPLAHLVELAAMTGDTSRARRLGALYFAQDSAADAADYVRWRLALALGDRAALSALRARLERVSTGSLRRIVGLGQVAGVGLDDVGRAAEILRTHEGTPSERRLLYYELHSLALNRGLRREALSLMAAYAEVEAYPGSSLDVQVLDALFGGGDSSAAARAVRRLTSAADDAGKTPDPEARRAQAGHRCALEFWRLAHGDGSQTARTIALLEEVGKVADPSGASLERAICAAGLGVMLAASQGRADAVAADRLERALDRIGPATFGGAPVENIGRILLARAREAQGEIVSALGVVRRRVYHHFGTTYLASALREEGRLAILAGDRAGAARAYNHYLALRSDPEAPLRAEAEQVRAELRRLGH